MRFITYAPKFPPFPSCLRRRFHRDFLVMQIRRWKSCLRLSSTMIRFSPPDGTRSMRTPKSSKKPLLAPPRTTAKSAEFRLSVPITSKSKKSSIFYGKTLSKLWKKHAREFKKLVFFLRHCNPAFAIRKSRTYSNNSFILYFTSLFMRFWFIQYRHLLFIYLLNTFIKLYTTYISSISS